MSARTGAWITCESAPPNAAHAVYKKYRRRTLEPNNPNAFLPTLNEATLWQLCASRRAPEQHLTWVVFKDSSALTLKCVESDIQMDSIRTSRDEFLRGRTYDCGTLNAHIKTTKTLLPTLRVSRNWADLGQLEAFAELSFWGLFRGQ